ncbi:MAG: hypothetical protein CSA24_01985, partial [Deltaproteobacteria bacterium]
MLTMLALASGCGDVSTSLGQRARGLLADLPVAPEVVQERDLPDCSTRLTPSSKVYLATYPGARDLLVVFRAARRDQASDNTRSQRLSDGRADRRRFSGKLTVCVDTPEVVLRSLGLLGDQPPGAPGDDRPSEGDDDPVPINGTSAGSQANGDDDPVPINGTSAGS